MRIGGRPHVGCDRRTVEGMATDETTLPTTEDEWRVRLSPDEFRVLRQAGTEAPWSGEYVNTKTEGMYKCRACGADLYPSDTKFDSHCGWASFSAPLEENITEHVDRKFGMTRTEVRSKHADSHLGHVFDDGPRDRGGLRYCINSAAVRFVPREKLEEEGYGEYLSLFENDNSATG